MQNPWIALPEKDSKYCLQEDFHLLQSFNDHHRSRPHFQVQLNSIPEPFVGNPDSAKVVFLLLNPGHSEEDLKWQASVDFRKCFFQNLKHEKNQFPFYVLDPRFKDSGAGRWWRRKLSPMLAIHGEETVSKKIVAIQWFPYHSVRFFRLGMKGLLPSQVYSHWLTQRLIDEGKQIVVMRSFNLWKEVVKFKEEPMVLKNPRNPTFSKANLGEEAFEKLSDLFS